MKVDAVVLAGARNDGLLQEVSECEWEALVPVSGKPMFLYVIDALRQTDKVCEIVVVGPEELKEYLDDDIKLVTPANDLTSNVILGIEHLSGENKVLLVTSDIPFVTSEAINDFIVRCSDLSSDVYYPVVSKEANEKMFPKVQRTYFRLAEGTFTGGNLILVNPEAIKKYHSVVKQTIALRKKPWKLVRLLGCGFIIKFMFHKLTLSEIERRAEKIFGFSGVLIISPYPEIGVDIDKPSDWRLAEETFAKDNNFKEERNA